MLRLIPESTHLVTGQVYFAFSIVMRFEAENVVPFPSFVDPPWIITLTRSVLNNIKRASRAAKSASSFLSRAQIMTPTLGET